MPARVADENPRINAVVRLAEGALERARVADADSRAELTSGPLHGVPFTIKDSLDTAGVVTTAGTVGWRDRVPSATPPSSRGCKRLARSCSARRTRPSSRGPTRPTTTSTAGPRTRTTSTGRPAAAAAARRRRWRPGWLAVRHRQRQREQHPPPRAPVRRRGHQADERARPADRALARIRRALPVVHAAGADRPPRRGPGARPARDQRTRRR